MKGIDLGDLWTKVPQLRLSVSYLTSGKKEPTRRHYIRYANEFTKFCCDRWSCNAEEIDYSKCTVIQIRGNEICTPIRPEVIHEFLQKIPYSSNRRLVATRVIHRIFEHLVTTQVLSRNPAPRPPKEVPRNKKGPAYHQLESIVQEIRKMDEPYRMACILCWSAGLRVSEVCALQCRDLERVNGQWVVIIRPEEIKGRQESKHPLPDLSPSITAYLKWRSQCAESTNLLIYPNGHRLSPSGLRARLRQVHIAELDRHVTPHDLRRIYATVNDKFTNHPDVTRQALRHKAGNDRVTRGYVALPDPQEILLWTKQLPSVELADSLASVWLGLRH